MLVPPKSKEDSEYLEESKQHWRRSEHDSPLGNKEDPKLKISPYKKKHKKASPRPQLSEGVRFCFQVIGAALITGIITLGWNWFAAQRQMESYRQTALDKYIDEMAELILDRDLPGLGLEKTKDSPGEKPIITTEEQRRKQQEYLSNVAKAKTLTTLLLLNIDPKKQNILLDFLREERLCCESSSIGLEKPIYLLEGIRLEYSKLEGADLKGFNLKKINLIHANLNEAQLNGANLQGAFLQNAILTGAQLNGADLTSAQLGYADLSHSFLRGATLKQANLPQANLKEADLSEALGALKTDLSEAQLQGASLQEANLTGAILRGAKLGPPTEKENVIRHRTDLRNATLENADLRGADLTEADLRGARLQGAQLEGATLNKADLSGANLEGASGSDTSKAVLCNTTMQDGGVRYRDCWFNIFPN